METVLFLTHAEAGEGLGTHAREALAVAARVAQETGGNWCVGVVGGDVQAAVASIAPATDCSSTDSIAA